MIAVETVIISLRMNHMMRHYATLLAAYCCMICLLVSSDVGIKFAAADVQNPNLSLDYYSSSCPSVFETVRNEMGCAVASDPRNAAVIARLHMHDCFVQGCDGSVLLDDTVTLKGEKKGSQNIHSLKGFKLMDRIKYMVESDCPGVVSCADILAIAARDAIMLVGGPYWDVPVGRKDSRTASYELVDTNIPAANDGLVTIIAKFIHQGLSLTDMVALSGAHTIGMARCTNFRSRIYGDFEETSDKSPMSETYLAKLRSICPPLIPGTPASDDNNVSAFDYFTPAVFDNSYYQILLRGQGLLNSDQELYSSLAAGMVGETRRLVERYAVDVVAFFEQFAESMVKMGNITSGESDGDDGEVRKTCRFVNSLSHSE